MKIRYNKNEEREMKALMGIEPRHNGNINVCSAASDSTF